MRYAGVHRRPRQAPSLLLPAGGVITAAVMVINCLSLMPAQAAPDSDATALRWAETQAGAWYRWGGTGPYSSGYDCSGLVQAAYRHAGITLPRTTWGMLASPRLIRVPRPVPGALAFYGSGHVELAGGAGETFGALEQGTRVGWHRYGGAWQPTAFYAVR